MTKTGRLYRDCGYPLFPLFVLIFTLGMSAFSSAADGDEDFDELATFACPQAGELAAVRSDSFTTGVTVTTIPSTNTAGTRLVVSAALPIERFELDDLRLVAITKSGTTLVPEKCTQSAGTGQRLMVVTFLADFAAPQADIDRLVLQLTKPGFAEVTTLEPRTEAKSGQPVTKWGRVIDADDDCKVVATDDRLTITVPEAFHDLNPAGKVNAPAVMHRISGDFSFQVKVTGDFQPGKQSVVPQARPFNGAGIVVWESPKHFLRVERNAFWVSDSSLVSYPPLIEYFVNGHDAGMNRPAIKSDYFSTPSTWLRVSRKEKRIMVSISHDGTEWKDTRSFLSDFGNELQIGVGAINSSNESFVVDFEEFSLTADRVMPESTEPK